MKDNSHAGTKRILVAGGAGFIGSHLCARLLERGNEVVCLDSLRTGSIKNIAHLGRHPRFTLIRHDIVKAIFLEGVDQIYDLACPASPRHYQADPVHTVRTCVEGAINLLELARQNRARILQASTSEVYGDPQVHPQCEDYWGHVNPVGERSCYDEGKRCAETLFHDYGRQYGIQIKIARIFNTYGPNMAINDGRVVSNFVVRALAGEPLAIYGDGTQTRSFCYVDDLVEGLLLLMESGSDFTGPVNLGNPQEMTMLEIAEHIRKATGHSVPMVFEPLPSDDPTQRCPDISLARTRLGWRPKIDLEEGLRRTVAYFRALGVERLDDGLGKAETLVRDVAAS
jgi:UDP-glucuronate decarboxylase